jgi:hypothetical protein
MNQSIITAFILGFLSSVMFALAFFAGQQHPPVETQTYENQQILLDSKIHLIEMKVDVITEQKDTAELQSEYENIMHVLEQSHQYTGEGIVARDQAMRAAASDINEAIADGGKKLVEAIESLLDTIEEHLHSHGDEQEEEIEE